MRFAVLLAFTVSAVAFAQESEFKGKLAEHLKTGAASYKNGCATDIEVEWTGGKLGHNPRQGEQKEWNALSVMVDVGFDAVESACLNNAAVKEALAKVKKVTVDRSSKKGFSYKLAGTTLTISIDQQSKDNPATQRDAFVTQLKKSLDT